MHGELTVDVDADALYQWERNPRADRAQDVGSSPTTKPREEQMRTFGLFTVAAMGLCIATANSAAAQEHVFKLHHLLGAKAPAQTQRSEEHTSELQSLMRISYAVFCLKKKKKQ